MFSSALKSLTSNINSNYSISTTPSSTAGPWKIYDAKKKSTGKEVSIFVFDRRTLEAQSNSGLGRSSASGIKKAYEEVVERLKKEASSLARLRHPNVLELVEPVEELRNGGLQFATEAVTASLTGLLLDQDEQEKAGGFGGRTSRFVVEEADGTRRRKEVEIDELEIQKGLLQISKALEFLHENAGLVHGNLTPDSIFINTKSDWKISGLSFLSPPEGSNKPTSVTPIFLSEVLNLDPRLPRSVQINLDYASPDFVIDNNLNTSADMFSLGLLIVALYNSPHQSPLETNFSVTTYKRLFASSSSIPTATNGYLSSRPLPKELANSVLPRLIARRPAQRMTAREFQESAYFDNILVSTIRFLDSLPEKTPSEKTAFMRGLAKVIPSFPKSVLEKKVLPALLEEMKDKELLALILQNMFLIVQRLVTGKRAFTEKILPRLREIFLTNLNLKPGVVPEKDPAKESGLVVVLDNMQIITENTTGKEFHDEILPIICLAIESPTHPLVDSAMRSLPIILPVLDFSTIKNELFPVIAHVFSKTSSLGIKVRGLEAFVILAGGSLNGLDDDGLDGLSKDGKKKTITSALDKYTIQEKMVPLIRAIKTKEPAVMLAALKVMQQIGNVVDTEYLAMDVLPILWNMSLGPLLNLQQFQSFITLIKMLSTRVETEHTKKLQEMVGSNTALQAGDDIMSFGAMPSAFGNNSASTGDADADFERLVLGKVTSGPPNASSNNSWDTIPNTNTTTQPPRPSPAQPAFSWSTPPTPTPTTQAFRPPPAQPSRPDLSQIPSMAPTKSQFSVPLQPQRPTGLSHQTVNSSSMMNSPINWSTVTATAPASTSINPWSSPSSTSNSNGLANTNSGFSNFGMNNGFETATRPQNSPRPGMPSSGLNSFSLPPPPMSPSNAGMGLGSFSPPPSAASSSAFFGMQSQQPQPSNTTFGQFQNNGFGSAMAGGQQQQQKAQSSNNGMFGMMGGTASPGNTNANGKTGLDKWESLL